MSRSRFEFKDGDRGAYYIFYYGCSYIGCDNMPNIDIDISVMLRELLG